MQNCGTIEEMSVIPAAAPLVKYDTPLLISKNTDRKNKVKNTDRKKKVKRLRGFSRRQGGEGLVNQTPTQNRVSVEC